MSQESCSKMPTTRQMVTSDHQHIDETEENSRERLRTAIIAKKQKSSQKRMGFDSLSPENHKDNGPGLCSLGLLKLTQRIMMSLRKKKKRGYRGRES